MPVKGRTSLQYAWTGSLPVIGGWLAALAVCLLSWQLIGGSTPLSMADRFAQAEAAASADLADDLVHPGSPEFPNTIRALLQRSDVGFAYLRVRDNNGVTLASVGRLESLGMDVLPQFMARNLRLSLYRLISTAHTGPLMYRGQQVGTLEYGLLARGSSVAGLPWQSWLGVAGLLMGLPLLWWMTVRLRSELRGIWSHSSAEAVRDLSAEMAAASARKAPQARSAASEVLQQTQQQAGRLMEVFDHAVVMVDRQQRLSYMNELAERVIGHRLSDVKGRPLADALQLFGSNLEHPVSLPIAACLQGESDRFQEKLTLRRRQGHSIQLEVTCAPTRDNIGAINGVLIALRPVQRTSLLAPIAQADRGMVAAKDSSALSMMLLDQVLESVVTTDSQDRIQFANTRALDAFGYGLAELRGQHISKLLPTPFLKQAQLRVAHYMQNEEHQLPEVVAQRRDGTQFPVTLVVHPVSFRDREGHVVTVRKHIPVHHSSPLSPRLRHILDASPAEALVFDAEGLHLVEANNAARRNLGLRAGQFGRMSLFEICPKLAADTFESYAKRLRLGGEEQVVYRTIHQRADASEYEVEVRLHFFPEGRTPVYLLTAQDIASAADKPVTTFDEDRIDFLTHHDSLTGLPNRGLFLERLKQAVDEASQKQGITAVLYTGISGFRAINDEHGYDTGDRVVKAVANALTAAVGTGDSVARIGGDEFAILLHGLARPEDLRGAMSHIRDIFAKPMTVSGVEIRIEFNIGATYLPRDKSTAEQMLLHADAAMRQSRSNGGRQLQIFDSGTKVPERRQDSASDALRKLVAEGELSIDFQPLIDLQFMQTVAAEVLLHWQHPDRGVLRTVEQVLAASKAEALATEIVLWVMQSACEQYAAWRDMELPTVPILINMSALSLDHARLLKHLRELLALYRMPGEHLVICYGEAELLQVRQQEAPWLRSLRNTGARLCVDDVGSVDVETLRKLDMDLVRLTPRATAGLPSSPEALTLARGVIDAARRVGARIVAGQIERTDQMNVLSELGCHIFQGRLVGEVMTTREFARQLARTEVGVL